MNKKFLFLQIERFFLVILNLHNSKTTCDRRKPIVDLKSTSNNTSIERKKINKIYTLLPKLYRKQFRLVETMEVVRDYFLLGELSGELQQVYVV